MAKIGRYCLQKLIDRDKEKNLETWKIMSLRSDSIDAFSNFNTGLYRIFDTMENKIVPFEDVIRELRI